MKYIITGVLSVLIAITASVGLSTYDSPLSRFVHRFILGSIAYPTSVDTFVNPASTDSVATVSHAQQHDNENDAIHQLELKTGTGASTAIANSILAGNGSGSSVWTTTPTTTNLTLSGVLKTANTFATASSTFQNFVANNSTTSNATTTGFAITSLSSQIPYAGATGNITALTVGSGLTLTGSTLAASAISGVAITSTTSVVALATTTISVPAAGKHLHFMFQASTTASIVPRICLNNDCFSSTNYGDMMHSGTNVYNDNAQPAWAPGNFVGGSAGEYSIILDISNNASYYKVGWLTQGQGLGNNAQNDISGVATWKNATSQITSITVSTGGVASQTWLPGAFMQAETY